MPDNLTGVGTGPAAAGQQTGAGAGTQQNQGPGVGQQQAEQSGAQGQQGGTPATFEAWLAGQADEAKSLYEAHTQGLRSALETERQQRKDLAHQLREATKGLQEGSAVRISFRFW